jgi:hypothetical protein
MNINNDHDALAGKKRYVQSLTRSRARFLNDVDFLKPITSKVTEDTDNAPQPNYNTQSTLFFDQGTKETLHLRHRESERNERLSVCVMYDTTPSIPDQSPMYRV